MCCLMSFIDITWYNLQPNQGFLIGVLGLESACKVF